MAKSQGSPAFRYLIVLVTSIVASGTSPEERLQALAGPRFSEKYSPVAPPEALLFATRLNLKLVGDWLGDGDFESATETAQRIELLLDLWEARSTEESWRHRVGQMRSQCDRLIERAKQKDAAGSLVATAEMLSILGSLGADLPKADKGAVSEFTARGSVRAWMKLLDGSYTDAKVAKSLSELTPMAYTIAEAANAAQFLRNDARWRERATAAREAALKVAALNPDTDLKVARQELKNVYERCEACHKAFRR